MRRLRAFFGGLTTPTTSEFWLGWGGLAMKALTLGLPPLAVALDQISGWVGLDSGKVLIASVLTYAVGRMTSKAVKAKD